MINANNYHDVHTDTQVFTVSGRGQKYASTTCSFSAVQLTVDVLFSRERKMDSKKKKIEDKCHKFIIVVMENFIVKMTEIFLSPCPRFWAELISLSENLTYTLGAAEKVRVWQGVCASLKSLKFTYLKVRP